MANVAGTTGADNLTGSSTNDDIRGTSGFWLQGTFISTGNDTGNDTLTGLGGNDLIYGYGGNDIINGGAGRDSMYGGDGDDSFRYLNGQNGTAGEIVDGGAGNDKVHVYTTSGTDYYFDLVGVDFVSIEEIEFSSEGTVRIYANEIGGTSLASNLLVDGFNSAGVREVINILMDTDTYVNISGWQFQDWGGQDELIIITGDNDAETMIGSSKVDTIYGNGGDDILEGGAGKDNLYGGAGDDIIRYKNGQNGTAGEIVDGGLGTDKLQVYTISGTDYAFDLRGVDFRSIEEIQFNSKGTLYVDADEIGGSNGLASNLRVFGFNSTNNQEKINIYMGAATNVDISGWLFLNWGLQNEKVYIYGDNDAETIVGSSRDDSITASGGNDTIEGGRGVDSMYGGVGNDTFRYTNGQDGSLGEFVDGSFGTDRVLVQTTSGTDYDFDLSQVDFKDIEEIEFMSAGTVHVDGAEVGNGLATDLLVDGYLPAGGEALRIHMQTATQVDISAWRFTHWGGNNERIHIHGDGDAETMVGSSKDDSLYGNAGNDILEGGDGVDQVYGGTGDDVIRFTNGQDGLAGEFVDGGSGLDKLLVKTTSGTDYDFDLRNVNFQSIERLQFDSTGSVHFQASEVGSGLGLSAALGVQGYNASTKAESIHLHMDADTNLDISGWQFRNWGSQGEMIYILGDNDAETVVGSVMDDTMTGGGGNDTFTGNDGNDTLEGDAGADRLYGNDGNDILRGGNDIDRLEGGAGNDTLYGGGDAWRDYMYGGTGDDKLYGGGGNDQMWGGEGADRLYGESGNDTLRGDKGIDRLEGGAGNDTLYGGGDGWRDYMYGGIGNDTLYGGGGRDQMWGGDGEDTLYGENGDDVLRGDKGIDHLEGGAGDDILYGGGDGWRDYMYGGVGNDTLYGGGGRDQMWGGDGEDTLYGENGDDTLRGDNGADRLFGGDGNDTLFAGADNSADRLFGNLGNDFLYGGGGNDHLWGGYGNDRLFGQAGADIFHYDKKFGIDTVEDFEDNVDKIDLTAWGFANAAQALALATQVGSDVKFNFTGVAGASPNDYLWVKNTTIAALQDDILV